VIQPSQDTPFMYENDLTNAVVRDSERVRYVVAASGLTIVAEPPKIRAFHRRIRMKHSKSETVSVGDSTDTVLYSSEPSPLSAQSTGL
jgi:hypothetical protein